jgi:uracil DNA glycosylase
MNHTIFDNTIPESWENVFIQSKKELKDVESILKQKEKKGDMFFPLKRDIFNFLHRIKKEDVKVVLINKEPYKGRITLQKEDKKITVPRYIGTPFILREEDVKSNDILNIEKEVKRVFNKDSVDITTWNEKGVLSLNLSLTTPTNQKSTHGKLWFGFVYKLIQEIKKVNPECIYVLFGRMDSIVSRSMIGDKCEYIETLHPLSYKFYGCDCFLQINEELKNNKKEEIDW